MCANSADRLSGLRGLVQKLGIVPFDAEQLPGMRHDGDRFESACSAAHAFNRNERALSVVRVSAVGGGIDNEVMRGEHNAPTDNVN